MSDMRIKPRVPGNTGEVKVDDLGTLEIQGKIYKPTVFYVLARSEQGYRGLDIEFRFLDRIVKGLSKMPF